MHVLVTGGLGFVGLNIVRFLAAQPGVTVVAADLTAPQAEGRALLAPVQDAVQQVLLDIRDRSALRHLIQEQKITHVVHGAAITASEAQEMAQPTLIVDVNLGGTVNVLDAAIACGSVERVVTISSSGVYAVPKVVTGEPVTEEGPLALDNLYAITKQSGELLTAHYRQLSGKLMTSVRLAAVYGPGEAPRESRTRTSTVHQLLAAVKGGAPIRVAGAEISRDWLYAEDVGRAIWSLLVAGNWQHPVYNVSSGQLTHFWELVTQFEAHGLQAEWVDDPDQADIAMYASQRRDPLDIGKLHSDTGFTPRFYIATGIATLLAHSG